jgi:photosystem II stability/assembly factor-like uncharacterized protein
MFRRFTFLTFFKPASTLAIVTLWSLILSLMMLGLGSTPAYAHRPHDVVAAVQVSPTYSEDSTLYIIVRNNLFRSENGGETWDRLSTGLDDQQFPASLAVAPANGKVLYTASPEAGIYQSLDGGNTWQPSNGDLTDIAINWVRVAPDDANLVFAQIDDTALYKTTDGGKNWTAVIADRMVTALAWSPDRSLLLMGDADGNLYRSDDEGDTWQRLVSLPQGDIISQLAFSPNFASDRTFWVATGSQGVYRSTDAGQTLSAQNQGLDDLRVEDIAAQADGNLLISTWERGYWHWDTEQQLWINTEEGLTRDAQADEMGVPHFTDLSFSNTFGTDRTVFLAGFDGLYRSTNGGETWTPLETLSLGTIIDMAISPTFAQDNTLAVATYVGELYLSRDRGETWEAINQDLYLPRFTQNFRPIVTERGEQDPRRFFDIEISPNYVNDQTLFASILYDTVLRSTNSGQNWALVNTAKRGVSLALSPNFKQDQTVFSTNQSGLIYRSQDGGRSFQQVAEGPAQVGNNSPSLRVSPNFAQDSTVFTTGEEGVYRSEDGGQTWQSLTQGTPLTEAGELQLAIAADYADSQTVFAASHQGLYRSQDRGNTWQAIDNESLNTQSWIEAITLSPNYGQDKTLMVSVRGQGLLISTDGGQSFAKTGNHHLGNGPNEYGAVSRATTSVLSQLC